MLDQLMFLDRPSGGPVGERGTLRPPGVESFYRSEAGIARRVLLKDGSWVLSPLLGHPQLDSGSPVGKAQAEKAWLRTLDRPGDPLGPALSVVDLFSGCGGLSLGFREAARSLGLRLEVRLAVDTEPSVLAVYNRNFDPKHAILADVTTVFDGAIGSAVSSNERELIEQVGEVNLLVGGPPCEGHSDFNNRTRHSDARNHLYERMVRAAEVLEPEHIVIENVPGALRDRGQVVQRSVESLSRLGYDVALTVVDLSQIGVPQRRRRLVVAGSLTRSFDFKETLALHATEPRTVGWGIGDLEQRAPDQLLDTPANSAPDTRRRISYLFEHDLYELPDSERPACHSERRHTYKSIYGRLRWEEPAQTITSGFYSMCMGRYVHPSQQRTLTAHEAARLQFFPDSYDFSSVVKRVDLARMIGDAVPSKLGYVVALELLR